MHKWVIWLIAIVALCLPAEAKDATKFALNGWLASSYKDPASGQFSHCAALAMLEGGSSAVIRVDRNFVWSLGFGISNWRFEQKTIPLSFRFDGGPWSEASGAVQNPTFVTLVPPARTSLVELLKDRQVMEAELDGEVVYLQFYDSDELIGGLASCYRQAALALRLPQSLPCEEKVSKITQSAQRLK